MTYSTNWQPVEPRVGMQPINAVSTTQNHPLGTRIKCVDRGANANGEGEFIYVKGVTNGALGAWVGVFHDGGTTVLAVADGIYGLVGVMMSVLDATTDFGWVQVKGKAVGLALTGFADDALVYLTSTAGSVDDSAVAGDLVAKAKGASALDGPATGMAEFEINDCFTDNNTDDATA